MVHLPQQNVGPTGAESLDMPPEQRVPYLRSLGVRNLDPPLPPSSHLKIRATGKVITWHASVASQTDLVDNCDEYGNTDPAAWVQTVPAGERPAVSDTITSVIDQRSQVYRQPEEAAIRTTPDAPFLGGVNLGNINTIEELMVALK